MQGAPPAESCHADWYCVCFSHKTATLRISLDRDAKAGSKKSDADPSNTVHVSDDPAERPRLIAQLAVTPSLQGASTIKRWSQDAGDLDGSGLIDELRQQAATNSSGD
jgi:hypothetical protein